MFLWYYELESRLGPMRAGFNSRGRLRELAFGGLDPRKTSPLAPKEQREAMRFLLRQLEAYLAGTLRTFTVPLEPMGTEVQGRVWEALGEIPYGQTLDLEELASRLGLEVETVRTICLSNPIVILVPAHRVPIQEEGLIPAALREVESGRPPAP